MQKYSILFTTDKDGRSGRERKRVRGGGEKERRRAREFGGEVEGEREDIKRNSLHEYPAL